MYIKKTLLMMTSLLVLNACSEDKDVAREEQSVFRPKTTIQEIMQNIIDPNIDPIWNAVQTIVVSEGTQHDYPKTEQEWLVLRSHAITLREAGNLLLIDNRLVARENTSAVAAELLPSEIQKLLSVNRRDFVKHVYDLQDAADELIVAIDGRNVDKLEEVGARVDQVCEACHQQFWYPGDKRPEK